MLSFIFQADEPIVSTVNIMNVADVDNPNSFTWSAGKDFPIPIAYSTQAPGGIITGGKTTGNQYLK